MIDTKQTRIDIDKPRAKQMLWLTKNLVVALDEVDRRQWISVEERLPEETGNYWVYRLTGTMMKTRFTHTGYKIGYTTGYWGGRLADDITHWMPLPDPPEDSDEKV